MRAQRGGNGHICGVECHCAFVNNTTHEHCHMPGLVDAFATTTVAVAAAATSSMQLIPRTRATTKQVMRRARCTRTMNATLGHTTLCAHMCTVRPAARNRHRRENNILPTTHVRADTSPAPRCLQRRTGRTRRSALAHTHTHTHTREHATAERLDFRALSALPHATRNYGHPRRNHI